jgi:hypothetical protein
MTHASQPPFLWVPGEGYDEAALGRLQNAFPRPTEPMGEAWFMSAERRMFSELCGDLRDVPEDCLGEALTEIGSGTAAFGPQEEWRAWFHYLLPRLVPRSHETTVFALLELLVTAFITQYPGGLEEEPYRGFRSDVLNTLGRCTMDGMCWPQGVLDVAMCLNKYYVGRRGLWFWGDASRPLSASMFFCLKYLQKVEIKPWMSSVLRIDDRYWRAQVMIWLLGAHKILSGSMRQPSEFLLSDHPSIHWEWSHCLSGNYTGIHDGKVEYVEFIPAENRHVALEVTTAYFTEPVFLEWLKSFSADPALEAELADKPYQFFKLYASSPNT